MSRVCAIQKVGLLLKSITMLFAKTDYKNKAFKRRRVLLCHVTELDPQPILSLGGRRGCDRMVVGFTNTCANSVFHQC
jgi:hypothetical protein